MTKNTIANLTIRFDYTSGSLFSTLCALMDCGRDVSYHRDDCYFYSDNVTIIEMENGLFFDYCIKDFQWCVEIYTLEDGEVVEPVETIESVETEEPVEMLSASIIAKTIVKHQVCINNGLITKCKELSEIEIKTLISMNKSVFNLVTVEYGTFKKTMMKSYSQISRLNAYIEGSVASYTITFYTDNHAVVMGF